MHSSIDCCSVVKSCPTLCSPVDCCPLGSCPPLSPGACSNSCLWSRWCHPTISSSTASSAFALNPSQHQGLFQWVSSSHQVVKIWSFLYSPSSECLGLISFRIDWFAFSTTVWNHQFLGTQPSLWFNPHICTCCCCCSCCHFSCVWPCATPETAAQQAPPPLGFSRQEHWSGLPFPSPMHESESLSCARFFATPWTAAHQAPPSMGFSRQEYGSWVPLASPTSVHDYWENHSFDLQTFVSQVMSLLFNRLSRFVIAFLPRSKCLFISWLQSQSVVILEPKKIKSVTVSTFFLSVCHEVMGPDAMILVFSMVRCFFF